MIKLAKTVTLLCFVFGLIACATNKVAAPIPLASIRGNIGGAEIIEKNISLQEFQTALRAYRENDPVRIVELNTSTTSTNQAFGIKEYRLFGVKSDTPYGVLGLETADVVVGAHGYLIQTPRALRNYLAALGNGQDSTLEIRRESKPIIFKIHFVQP